MCEHRIYVGTAAWAIPRAYQDAFPNEGSHLVRYTSQFDGVEINSSFYRPHRLSTYQRWADDVPNHFRFAVKMPKTITHEGRLRNIAEPLQRFLGEIAGLGDKLGPVIIQLPPSLKFDSDTAEAFFRTLRDSYGGDIVCEPRHATWFSADVDTFFVEWKVARVAADPQPHPDARQPVGGAALHTIASTARRRCTIRPIPTRNSPKSSGNSRSLRLREHGLGVSSITRRNLPRRPTP